MIKVIANVGFVDRNEIKKFYMDENMKSGVFTKQVLFLIDSTRSEHMGRPGTFFNDGETKLQLNQVMLYWVDYRDLNYRDDESEESSDWQPFD